MNTKKSSAVKKKTEKRVSWITLDGTDHLSNQLDSLNKLHLLLSYENDKQSLNSLYHMYVYILCSFIESLLRVSYRSVLLKNVNDIRDPQHRQLISIAQENLNNLTWEFLKKEEKTYLGIELPKKLKEGPSYQAINILFRLRNLLIHGSFFEKCSFFDVIYNSSFEITSKGADIYTYLLNQKLIDKEDLWSLEHYEINSKVVLHFLCNVNDFRMEYFEFLKSLIEIESVYYNQNYNKVELSIEKFKAFASEKQ